MTYACVTTMNKDYFDNIGYQMIESYIKYWPKHINLYVYLEDFELPYTERNIITLDISEKCNPNMQSFINDTKKSMRKFAYKAYAWMHACKTLPQDTLIWLDADTETIDNVEETFLDTILPNNELIAYMYAPGEIITRSGEKVPADNAETCIFFYNNKHAYANQFMQRYEHIYESRELHDKYRFGKPHDTWATIDCVKWADENGIETVNLHPTKKNRTPLKKTVLVDYFTHAKGKSKYAVAV
jgi:hypothetical protein